jgi:hypothetical protein
MRHALLIVLATLTVVSTTACSEAASERMRRMHGGDHARP